MKTEQLIKEYEESFVLTILRTLEILPFNLGIKRFAGVLKGTKSTFNIDYKLYQVETFSLFKEFSTKGLENIVQKLIKEGFVEVEKVSNNGFMTTLKITIKGQQLLDGNEDLNLNLLELLGDKNVIILGDEDKVIFDELRKMRLKISKEKEVPPYVICNDNDLRKITIYKPESVSSLIDLKGIGKKFIQEYGDEFVNYFKTNKLEGKLENELEKTS